MSGLLFLNYDDFTTKKVDDNKQILCNTIQGISLILFYSTSCEHCSALIPIFKLLPKTLTGCHIGLINVMRNKQIINESKKTITPITYVPYVVLYWNGRPYMKYIGAADIKEITKFVLQVSKNIHNKNQKRSNENSGKNSNEIPPYSVGIPLYGKDRRKVCYLDMDKSYITKKK